jgi:hypothetical protein
MTGIAIALVTGFITGVMTPPKCHPAAYRYIGEERVPWSHSEDDHEWDEFDHTTDECEPPPC